MICGAAVGSSGWSPAAAAARLAQFLSTCQLAVGHEAAELAAGGQRAPLPQHERRLRRRLRSRLPC